MGRATLIDGNGMKKGEWTTEEDQKLVAYINDHGTSDWRFLPRRAGLQRCGKSCRLRWINYLRPGIKRGKFTPQEEQNIIKLHAVLGSRWTAIAKQMENRTDNDIKNHWNSCLKKRLWRNGIDPMTHGPYVLGFGFTRKNVALLVALLIVNGINNLTVKITNEECGSSATTASTPMESPSLSSPSGSARLLNKLATDISSRQQCFAKIKNILRDFSIGTSDQDGEEEEKRESKMDQNIGGGEEDYFPMWSDEDVVRYMETDATEYETTSYDSVLYDNTHVLDHLF